MANPLFVEAVGAILRWALNIGAGYLVEHGIWSQSNAETYVGAAAMVLITLGWDLWQKYRMRLKILTASASAGLSEKQVEAIVKDPATQNPSVTHPKDEVPTIPTKPS